MQARLGRASTIVVTETWIVDDTPANRALIDADLALIASTIVVTGMGSRVSGKCRRPGNDTQVKLEPEPDTVPIAGQPVQGSS